MSFERKHISVFMTIVQMEYYFYYHTNISINKQYKTEL